MSWSNYKDNIFDFTLSTTPPSFPVSRQANMTNTPERSTISSGQRSNISSGQRSTVSSGQRSTISSGQMSTISSGQRSTISGQGSTISGQRSTMCQNAEILTTTETSIFSSFREYWTGNVICRLYAWFFERFDTVTNFWPVYPS